MMMMMMMMMNGCEQCRAWWWWCYVQPWPTIILLNSWKRKDTRIARRQTLGVLSWFHKLFCCLWFETRHINYLYIPGSDARWFGFTTTLGLISKFLFQQRRLLVVERSADSWLALCKSRVRERHSAGHLVTRALGSGRRFWIHWKSSDRYGIWKEWNGIEMLCPRIIIYRMNSRWSPEFKMESWIQDQVLNSRWSPEFKMESWIQDGVLNPRWSPEFKMESWIQDGVLNSRWSPESKMESWIQDGVLHSVNGKLACYIITIYFFYTYLGLELTPWDFGASVWWLFLASTNGFSLDSFARCFMNTGVDIGTVFLYVKSNEIWFN